MRIKPRKETAVMLLGAILFTAGGIFVVHPRSGYVLHIGGDEVGRYYLDWMSREGSRIYGVVALILGAGLIWLARWPRWGAQRTAVEDYVWRLSQELSQHFGAKKYYSVQEVSRLAGEGGYNMAHLAYAHAIFCSRADFDAYYGPLQVRCTYDGLRDVIARRYLWRVRDFDATTIVRFATPPKEEEYNFTAG